MSDPKFVRQGTHRHSKLGKKRKKLQIWRMPKGMHSKIRQSRKGHAALPRVGYKSPRSESGKIGRKDVVLIRNMGDLSHFPKDSVAILARVGAKKKLEMIKAAIEMKVRIVNLAKERKK